MPRYFNIAAILRDCHRHYPSEFMIFVRASFLIVATALMVASAFFVEKKPMAPSHKLAASTTVCTPYTAGVEICE
jgi:hypothetical protein